MAEGGGGFGTLQQAKKKHKKCSFCLIDVEEKNYLKIAFYNRQQIGNRARVCVLQVYSKHIFLVIL